MKKVACCLVVLLFAGLCLAENPARIAVARWPGDRQAAVSLTFDDAMLTHLRNAAPVLKKHHVTGTFYVTTGWESWRNHLEEWRRLAQDGNEIGNHTVTHPCLLERITPHSQEYTSKKFEAEIRDAASEIRVQIPNQRGLTFAYPCDSMSFGPVADQSRNMALYLRFVAEHSFAARGYGVGGPQNPDEMNVLAVPDLGVTEGKDFPALLAMAYPALRNRNWGIFCFHGVGGEWLSTPTAALDELSGYLERHPEIWTATFADGVRYIQERHALGIKETVANQQRIEAELNWPLDSKIFDLPLTLKIPVPASWKIPNAEGDSKALVVKDSGEGTERVLLVDVPPGTRKLAVFSQ